MFINALSCSFVNVEEDNPTHPSAYPPTSECVFLVVLSLFVSSFCNLAFSSLFSKPNPRMTS
ncbi:hypothetical protein NWQ33_00790 [Mycoplasmopsis cynos]|nr:hypothetical protein [Mycoplasmopsis cynos]